MEREKIKAAVIASAENIQGKKDLHLDDSAKFVSELGFESIDIIELIFELERRLGCEIDLEELAVSNQRFNQLQDLSLLEFVIFLEKQMPSL